MHIIKETGLEVVEATKAGGRIRITAPSLDRDRDRVLPLGGQIEAYRRNPVVQWGHQYSEPWQTIGRATSLEVTADGIDATFELRAPANESDPQHIVMALWEQGMINAASIGFKPLTLAPNQEGGVDYTSWELLEFSLVPIPANRDAMRLAYDAHPHAAKAYAAASKAGRVLSKGNEAKLRSAYAAIGEVLAQLGSGDEDEGKDGEPSATKISDDTEALRAMVYDGAAPPQAVQMRSAILGNLARPSQAGRKAMDELGLTFDVANPPSLVQFCKDADRLTSHLSDMDKINRLVAIFGLEGIVGALAIAKHGTDPEATAIAPVDIDGISTIMREFRAAMRTL